MTSVGLGMPALPPPVLSPRRQTRQIKVGSVGVGSGASRLLLRLCFFLVSTAVIASILVWEISRGIPRIGIPPISSCPAGTPPGKTDRGLRPRGRVLTGPAKCATVVS